MRRISKQICALLLTGAALMGTALSGCAESTDYTQEIKEYQARLESLAAENEELKAQLGIAETEESETGTEGTSAEEEGTAQTQTAETAVSGNGTQTASEETVSSQETAQETGEEEEDDRLEILVFGDSIRSFLDNTFPIAADMAKNILSTRSFLAIVLLVACFTGLYTYLPHRHLLARRQLPGALFSTFGWMLFSYGFSMYFNFFSRFSYMYGSLTAIILLMLWIYFCICILFLGAEINCHLDRLRQRGYL